MIWILKKYNKKADSKLRNIKSKFKKRQFNIDFILEFLMKHLSGTQREASRIQLKTKCLIFPKTTLNFAWEYGNFSTFHAYLNIPVWRIGLNIFSEDRASIIIYTTIWIYQFFDGKNIYFINFYFISMLFFRCNHQNHSASLKIVIKMYLIFF